MLIYRNENENILQSLHIIYYNSPNINPNDGIALLISDRVLSDINSNRYTIKIADTENHVEAALKLRYEVFKEELNRDFEFNEQRDKDEFDDQSHHLIVLENDTDTVVGTYRLQTYEQAISGNGFVSEKRFHLEQFSDGILENAVEVGRACIRKEHRSGRVLFLLWKGFAGYLTHFEKRYLFGYAALEPGRPEVAINTYHHLKTHGFIHPKQQIDVKDAFRIDSDSNVSQNFEVDIPPLFQNYLDVGCYVCGKPSFNKESQLAHFLILLDIENISDRTRKLFFS